MKNEPRYPELVGLKLSRDLATELRRAARREDRSVSAYLRRLVAAALRPTPDPSPAEGEDR
jgi:hypothetical protein